MTTDSLGAATADDSPGRVVLITGAAGGIGRALARAFAGAGYRLVLTDLSAEALARIADGLPEATVLCRTADLTNEEAVQHLFAAIEAEYGRLDIAVNAAGLLRTTPLEGIRKAEWDQVLDANLGSCFLVCRECCAPMRRQGWGRIINFSSVAGQTGGILSGAHYAASKAAIISLTRSLAKLLAADGVRVNAIAPAGVETDMLAQFPAEQKAALLAGIPAGRFGTPEEIAQVVLWLCSPAAEYITGQTINVNGGSYLG